MKVIITTRKVVDVPEAIESELRSALQLQDTEYAESLLGDTVHNPDHVLADETLAIEVHPEDK